MNEKQGEKGMSSINYFSRENAHELAEEVYKILLGVSLPIFPNSSKGVPSRYVLLGKIQIDTVQYHRCVLPVLEREDLQMKSPRSREFMKDTTRTQMFIKRIGGFLTDSFAEEGF